MELISTNILAINDLAKILKSKLNPDLNPQDLSSVLHQIKNICGSTLSIINDTVQKYCIHEFVVDKENCDPCKTYFVCVKCQLTR